LAASNGKLCSFYENEVRPMGRTAAGVAGMDLKDGSVIVGATGSFEGEKILVLSTRGYGKMSYSMDTDVVQEDGTTRHYDGYRLTHRGGKGVITMNLTPKNGKLCAVRGVSGDEDLLVVTQNGIVIRTPLSEVKIAGRNTQGVKIINMDDKSRVSSVAIIPHSDVAEDEEFEDEEAPVSDEEPVNPNELDGGIEG